MAGLATFFLLKVALYGLLLNALSEYGHLFPLYTCWYNWTLTDKIIWPILTILGDGVAVIPITLLASWIIGPNQIQSIGMEGALVFAGSGFTAGVVLERAAVLLKFWSYKPSMPVVVIGWVRCGISPILQMTLLPLLSVLLAQS